MILPDDTVLTTGGSEDYRGRGDSNILKARTLRPEDQHVSRGVADPLVGRNYHSGALLLPDGRVMIFGSDSLYADKANTKPGDFEQRIEIYTPPYLYRDARPKLAAGRRAEDRSRAARRRTFTTAHASTIKTARLIRPSAFTHVTDVEQRSIALDLKKTKDGITVTVPKDRDAGAVRLVHAVRDGRPGHAVRGGVGEGAETLVSPHDQGRHQPSPRRCPTR